MITIFKLISFSIFKILKNFKLFFFKFHFVPQLLLELVSEFEKQTAYLMKGIKQEDKNDTCMSGSQPFVVILQKFV